MRCRRDYRDLTPAEKTRFIAALYHVKAGGVVDAFADEHNIHFSHGHSNSSFLPWHREFIRRFEAELQTYDPRVMLCYWNSSNDQSTSSPLWDASFLGQFNSAWSLGRSLGGGGSLASPGTVDTALTQATYDVFRPNLESNVHNGPHNWVGGEMSTGRSPRDPVFFLHHCFIDMLWAQWQLRHPGAPFVPSSGAPGVSDHMHPWSTTVGDVLNHRTINVYSYPAGYVEDAPRVTPPPASPPSITFSAVPAGLTFLRPAIFQVDACENLTFNIANPVVDSGPAGTAFNRLEASIVVDPHVEPTGRVWISYRGTSNGHHATGHVNVTCVETGDAWVVPIVADVIQLPTAAIAMVLDQSNSMNFESGIAPGVPRSAVLRFSAPPCIDVLDENHAVTVISFDHDPHLLRGLTTADTAGRLQLNAAISGYAPNPEGWTAIGEAINYAHGQLNPVTGYNIKATVVLTDGQENHGPHDRLAIGDVTSLINERVYAIGLGTPANIQPAALQALCNGHDGYMLITGDLNPDAYFRLAKYYQQIISGVTNQDIVLDPDGWVHSGEVIRIPFYLAETDITARAVLLTDSPHSVIFGLETPGGQMISPSISNPMVAFRIGNAVEMYHVSLPLPIGTEQAQAGRWTALIGINARIHKHLTHGFSAGQVSARYSLSIHTLSNLRMRATLAQSSNEPGATIFLRAALTEYAIPLPSPASVRAEMVRPDETQSIIALNQAGAGAYEASVLAAQAGVYRFRIIAEGRTMRGRPFTREQTLTGAAWAGGDQPPTPPNDPGQRFCHFVHCLLKEKGILELLKKYGINPAHIARCLDEICRRDDRLRDPTERLKEYLRDDRALSIITDALRHLDITHE
jgi:hypothetical protein